MKTNRKILMALFMSLAMIACEDDDNETTPAASNNGGTGNNGQVNNHVTQADLLGTWVAFQIKSEDDNQWYGLNQYVSDFYTDNNGCRIEDDYYKLIRYDISFMADNNSTSIYLGEEKERDILTYDSINCIITYTNWTIDPESDTNSNEYQLLDSRNLIFIERDTFNDGTAYTHYDTTKYVITGNVMEMEGDLRFRKQ
jgi:hypothetical protein